MARPVVVSVTGVGISAPVLVDWRKSPPDIGVGCTVSGTITYSVEHAYEDPPVNWFADTNMSAKTANAETAYPGTSGLGPFYYIRLNVTAGTGTATMNVIAAGT